MNVGVAILYVHAKTKRRTDTMPPSSEHNAKTVHRPFKRLVHEGYIGVHQEPCDEGRRDSIAPRLVVRRGLLHGVLEVLQGVALYRLPVIIYTPRDVGTNPPFKGR